MGKTKVDRVKLSEMLRRGKTATECAQYFGVTPGAITRARQEINVGVVKNVALENAARVVNKELNAVDQLAKVNADAHELLDLCMRWMRGEDEALQILESQVRRVRVGRGEDAEEVTQYTFKDPREIALKAMARIEAQLKLQLEIFTALYDMKHVQAFQEEVLEAIAEVDPEIRNEIIRKLNERSALRRAISGS